MPLYKPSTHHFTRSSIALVCSSSSSSSDPPGQNRSAQTTHCITMQRLSQASFTWLMMCMHRSPKLSCFAPECQAMEAGQASAWLQMWASVTPLPRSFSKRQAVILSGPCGSKKCPKDGTCLLPTRGVVVSVLSLGGVECVSGFGCGFCPYPERLPLHPEATRERTDRTKSNSMLAWPFLGDGTTYR